MPVNPATTTTNRADSPSANQLSGQIIDSLFSESLKEMITKTVTPRWKAWHSMWGWMLNGILAASPSLLMAATGTVMRHLTRSRNISGNGRR
jgi:hypothetical protein